MKQTLHFSHYFILGMVGIIFSRRSASSFFVKSLMNSCNKPVSFLSHHGLHLGLSSMSSPTRDKKDSIGQRMANRTWKTRNLANLFQNRRDGIHLYADSSTNYVESTEMQDPLNRTWNIVELKKETARLTLRCHKKIDKASTRLQNALQIVEEIRTCPNPTQEQLESCPNTEMMKMELEDLRKRLVQLNELEESLSNIKNGKNVILPPNVAAMALDLQVDDAPPERLPSQPKKPKGPRTSAPRKPYFCYYTENKTEIRVGRRSEDNDELSTNPEHGDGPDWWMHASGCPGSHVVIRCHDNVLDKDVIRDAAALAARQSKCTGNVIMVNLCRWRDVKKPPGAKPGLVQLVGKVQTVSVNMKEAEKRLARLDATECKH